MGKKKSLILDEILGAVNPLLDYWILLAIMLVRRRGYGTYESTKNTKKRRIPTYALELMLWMEL